MVDLNPAFDAALLSRLEDAGLNASAPTQQLWLDGWLLRLSPGKAKRARCVNAVAAGRIAIEPKLDACDRAFAAAGLPMIVRITPFTVPVDLDDRLEMRGLRRFDDTRVMVLQNLGTSVPALLSGGVSLHSIDLDSFAERVGALRGSPQVQRRAHAERLRHSPVPYTAWELQRDGEALACGQYAIEDDVVGLYDVFTAPSARGHGFAGLLCERLLADAARHGAHTAYLQVESDNAPARAVYRRLGFAEGYGYHYRTRDPDAA